ncbi:hypothetical protein NI467_00005, partial [Acinetobacter bohemicus]|uniref:hypothetical protein n=1 Tax=Acinetobacter sp. S4397-1 TaxID=2972915 RepID=UPI00209A8376
MTMKIVDIFLFIFISFIFIKKKSPCFLAGGFLNNELAMTYSHMGNPTLPSAQRGFTSEFG